MPKHFTAVPTLRRGGSLRWLAALAIAAVVLLGGHLLSPAYAAWLPGAAPAKALVYCPPAEAAGCERVAQQLAGSGAFPGGVDKRHAELRTVTLAELQQYAVLVVPSLANAPYDVLRESAVQTALRQVLIGRVAVWSGTPDRGTTSGKSAGKLTLIQNLAQWAAGQWGDGSTGLVVLQDFSDAGRYGWVQGVSGVMVGPDLAAGSYATVEQSAANPAAAAIVGSLAYDNMASFGLAAPQSPALVGAWGQTGSGRNAARGQVVLLTAVRSTAGFPMTAAGGTITAQGGKVVLVFPAGAVSQDVRVTVDKAGVSATSYVANTAYSFGPSGLTFAQPVALTIGYAEPDVPGGVANEPNLALFEFGGGTWTEVPGSTVNAAANTVTGNISHFSRYAVFVRPGPGSPGGAPPGGGTPGTGGGKPVDGVAVSPATATVAAGLSQPLTATVTDRQGGALVGESVTWSATNGAVCAPLTGTTNASGQVTTTCQVATLAGTHVVTAAVGTKSGSSTLTVVAGPATKLAFSAQPSNATAGASIAPAIQVAIQDQYGNTVTTATGNVSVALGTNAAGGTLSGTTTVAAVNGVATFSTVSVDKAATGYTLGATSGGLTGATSNTFNVTPGTPATLAFTGQPSTTQAGASITPAVAVTIRDALGNTVTSATGSVTVAFGTNPSAGTLSGTKTIAAVNGVATFADLSVDQVGTGYTLGASSGALTPATSTAFSVVPAGASKLAFTVQPSNTAAGSVITPAVQVTIQDGLGNTVTTATDNVTIAIGTNAGSGTLSGTVTVAAVNGVATFTTLGIDKAGTGYTLAATSGSLTGATSTTFNVAAGAAAKLGVTVQPSNVIAGTAIAPAVLISVQDAYGNTVSGATNEITATIGTNPASGTLSGTKTVAAVSGVASFSTLSIDKAGTGYTLAASASGLTGATSTAFTVTPAAAAALAFSVQPVNTAAGGPITPAVQVAIRDAYGNTVTSSSASITLAIGTNPAGGALSGTATVAATNGVAAFSGLSIDKPGTGYTLAASAASLTGATSTAFDVTPGAPSKLGFTVQPSNATAGVGIAPAVQVAIQDAFGNTLASATDNVTIAIGTNAGTGTLSGTKTVAAVNGVATFTGLSIDKAAAGYTLGATSGSLAGATSTTFAISAAAASTLAFAQPPTTATAGSAIAPAVTVQVRDAFGNLVTTATTSVTIALGTNPTTATLLGTRTVSAVGGVATFSDLAIQKAGTGYTLAASATSLTGATSGAFNVGAGAAAALAFVQQPTTVGAGVAITPAVTVALSDQYGNATTGTDNVTIALGTNPGSGTLSGTATVAAVGGVATFSTLALDKVATGYTLAASSGALTGATSSAFAVTPGPVHHFVVDAAGGGTIGAQLAGTPFSVRVTAQDRFDNTASGFTGTVGFTSTPTGAISAGATSAAFTAGVLSTHAITFGTPGSFTLTATRTSGTESGTSNSFDVQAPPVAVNDGPTASSAPGQSYHTFYSTSGSRQSFTLAAPGVTSNDNLGFPAATITSFGADSLGGSVTTNAAGSTVAPLPGIGRTTGSLSVGTDGSITFTPPDGFTGNYVFRYRLTNVRGTSDGQVTIAVGARPVAVNDTYTPVLVGNVPINTATSTQFRVTTNDVGDSKVLAITGQSNGTATLNADSTFTFRPTAGFDGAASFTYTVTNGFGTSAPATVSMTVANPIWFVNAGAGAGGDGRYDAPFNALPTLAAINNGTGNNPAPTDRIFLYTGSYTGGLTLLSGQRLIGQGATASLSSIAGVTWPADAGAEPAMSGMAPTITGSGITALTLADVNSATAANHTLRGFNVGSVGTTGTALAGTEFGTLNVSEVGITTNGRALNLTTGTLGGTFSPLSSSGGANNVYLSGVATGGTTRTFGTAADALAGATGDAVVISGENGSFTFPGSITNTATLAVNVSGKTGGTVTFAGDINPAAAAKGISVGGNGTGANVVTFSGANIKINPGAGTAKGVSLVNNAGATISFTGGALAIVTDDGNGFEATGGGTVVVDGATDVSTIASAGGIALRVENTTIGAGGLNFRSISANGGASGIVLNGTGTTAGLTVTGNGGTCNSTMATCTGGTIQNTTGAGALLGSTLSPSFAQVKVMDTGGSGVQGIDVTNFSFTNGTISNSGTGGGANASNIAFNTSVSFTENNVDGTVTITGNTLQTPHFHAVDIFNWSGTVDYANVSNNTLTAKTGAARSQGSAIRLIARGTSTSAHVTRANLDNNTVQNGWMGAVIQAQGGHTGSGPAVTFGVAGHATNLISISGNTLTASSAEPNNAEGIIALINHSGQGNFRVNNNGTAANPIGKTIGTAISSSAFGNVTATGEIKNNYIAPSNSFGSLGIGIGTASSIPLSSGGNVQTPTYTVAVENNNISATDGAGILAVAIDASGRLNLALRNNIIAARASSGGQSLVVRSGNSNGNNTVCLDIRGNTSAPPAGFPEFLGIGLRRQTTNTNVFSIVGMAATATPGVESYVNGLNPNGGGTLLVSASSGFSSCSLP